jgi:hypothetical protein
MSNARSHRTLQRIRDFWSGHGPRRIVSICASPDYRQNPDEQAMLEGAVACILADRDTGENALPTFIPDFGTVSLPALWGGMRIEAKDGGCVHIEPILHGTDDLARSVDPRAYEDSDFARAEYLYREVCRLCGQDGIFVRTPDLQGPMNTLGLLMEQTELLLALYEAPEYVHRWLTQITDVTIAYLRRYRESIGPEKVIGNVWPWIVLPDGMGIGITEDFMPLLGPDLYAQFELPQLKRIADAFGGVFIHCCGEYAQHLPTLARADFRIWGIETHYPCTRLSDVYDALGDDLAYVPYVAPTGKVDFPSSADLADALAASSCASARMWLPLARTWEDENALKRLRQWASPALSVET